MCLKFTFQFRSEISQYVSLIHEFTNTYKIYTHCSINLYRFYTNIPRYNKHIFNYVFSILGYLTCKYTSLKYVLILLT
jgi:hypothetical protein